MFIFTTKISKKRIILGVVAFAIITSLIIILRPEENAFDVLSEQMMETEMVSITIGGIETNQDRIIFLSEKGWEVSENEISVTKVQIPTNFDEVYEKYNEMQVEQGFNLEKFKGKSVELYTYQILNHENTEEEIHANILIYKNKIIGGDVSSVKLDGFISGFDKR